MTDTDEPAALAYIEKALADSYRKEIDQEENVWRTLPFFAATLSLQLAALFQMIDKLPLLTTVAGKFSIVILSVAGSLTLISLGFLAGSIYPQTFDYVASEPSLLIYARALMREEQRLTDARQPDPFSALVTLKSELARQYAEGADHNRQINKRRERLRSVAGLAALASVAMTVFLVATAYAHYLSSHDAVHEECDCHAATGFLPADAPDNRSRTDAVGPPVQPAGPLPASHAGRDQGLVDSPGGAESAR